MKKHIFFDLDRTLWDFETNSHQTLAELYEKYHLSDLGVKDVNAFIAQYKLINEKLWVKYREDKISQNELRQERFQQTLALFHISDPALAAKIGEDYVTICPRKTKLYPHAIEILDYLKSKYTLHIITNGFHQTQHIKLKHANLTSYFTQIITSEQVGFKKPNPKIFEYALTKANAIAQESVYIGDDLEVDILACQQCGIDGVFFNAEKMKHNKDPKFEISCLSELKTLF